MRLEYFEDDGVGAREVLLTYGADHDSAEALRAAAVGLARGEPGVPVQVELLPGFVSVHGCSLLAVRGDEDLGVHRVSGSGASFRCVLTALAWRRLGGLVEPFTVVGMTGFQFLADGGEVDWIISTSRSW